MKKIIAALITVSAVGLTAPAFAQDTAAPAAPAPAAPAPDAAPAADAAAAPGAPAQAATAKAGDTVYDTSGAQVATIESVEGANAVISTGTNKATVPLSSFASGPNGPVISMSKAQLDAAIQGANGSSPKK